MLRFSTLPVAALGVLLLIAAPLSSCGDDGSTPLPTDHDDDTLDPGDTPRDQLVVGPFAVDEAGIHGVVGSGTLEVTIPVANAGNAPGEGTYLVVLRHIETGEVAQAAGAASVPVGQGEIVAVIGGLPALDTPALEAEYIVDLEVVLDDLTMWCSRSLLVMTAKADLIVLSPDELLEGQSTAVRAFLVDPTTGEPITGADVDLQVTIEDAVVETISAQTDLQGAAVFLVPPLMEGQVGFKALVSGDDTAVQASVLVMRESKLLLTTDKPLYQPGQQMHLRALGLNRADLSPLADDAILFEVFDAKGNKVYKAEGATNDFGVAWGTFTLATQVNLGTYTVKATLGDVVSEKSVTVDRYSLPKFELQVDVDKTWYLPGMTVSGEVRADYFFGKAVAGGTVNVTPYTYEATWTPLIELTGQTNAEGIYHFEFELPDYVVGQPLDQGKGLVMLEVVVTDTADHEQAVARQIIVAADPLDVVVVPESGDVVPGVENIFYVFVSDPTGSSVGADAELTVEGGALVSAAAITIPAAGPAKVVLMPESTTVTLDVHAEDGWGNAASKSFAFAVGDTGAAILLRTDQAIYAVGDPLTATVYATGGHSHVFVDVIRKNQTVLTKTLELVDGTATTIIDLDSELTEDLVLDVYMLSDAGQIIRDTRVVYVQPASDLKLTITTDKPVYEPGETATVTFAVEDQEESPVQAALGIQVVDEAVFALSEMKPGLLELYFRLEDELSAPSYQIGAGMGWSFGGLFAAGAAAEPGSDEEAAVQDTTTAALAALDGAALNQTRTSSWDADLLAVKAGLEPFFDTLRLDLAAELEGELATADVEYEQACDFLGVFVATHHWTDFWGATLAIDVDKPSYWECAITVHSGGPDELDGTPDDWSGTLDLQSLATGEWDKGWDRPMAEWGEDVADGGGWGGDDGEQPPGEDPNGGGDSEGSEVKVRSWFPETLYIEPSLITGPDGTATLDIPLADSITEWRMTTLGSSKLGHLGSRTDGIVVFQDFFVDIDFPKYLTQNDEITFPVAIYNYMEAPQTVTVSIESSDWFLLLGAHEQSMNLEPGQVSVLHFPVKVMTVGWHSLTVYGSGQGTAQDAIMRTVEVKPDGQEVTSTTSARFDNDGETPSTDHVITEVSFPPTSIPNSQSLTLQILPGLSSHIVSGMDGILQLPGGCFEQTTSSAWPNVLALRYMFESGTITPEIELTALQYVSAGYQRILTFECNSGGFNWWEGDDPGNAILSAVGVMMLEDTKSVYDTVDEKVIERSCDYLQNVQKSDGAWSEEKHLHAGNENLGAGSLRATCYIAWAMAYGCPSHGSTVNAAMSYIQSKLPSEPGMYTRAMCANALVEAGAAPALADQLLTELHEAAIVVDDTVHWTATGDTLVNSYGNAADVEVTSLVALAMATGNAFPSDVNGAVNWLVASKDPQGNWGYNTQATVLALRTFLAALTLTPGDTDADLTVLFNGNELATKHFDDFNKDVVWQLEVPNSFGPDANILELEYSGLGALSYQVVATHYLPWTEADLNPTGPLSITVDYDTTDLAVDDLVTATVTISNNDPEGKGMVLVTVGLPPGFSLVTSDLDHLKEAGTLATWETAGKQLILYFDELPAGEPISVSYSLQALYPIKAQTGGAEIAYYYDAETKAEQESQEIEVTD